MFLYIFEDGTHNVYETVSEDDLQASDDGYLDIFDCADPACIKFYFSGEWKNVEAGKPC